MIAKTAALAFSLFLGTLLSSLAAEPGDSVLAYWAPGEAYFLGTVLESTDAGYQILFEDGDQAAVPKDKIRPNTLAIGSPVIARWKDGNYYSGKIERIVGRAYFIHYDDGDRSWAPCSWIAVR